MKIQTVTANSNKLYAISVQQTKIVMQENSLLKEKLDRLYAEISLTEVETSVNEREDYDALEEAGDTRTKSSFAGNDLNVGED